VTSWLNFGFLRTSYVIIVFWNATPCSAVASNQRFRGTCGLNLQGIRLHGVTSRKSITFIVSLARVSDLTVTWWSHKLIIFRRLWEPHTRAPAVGFIPRTLATSSLSPRQWQVTGHVLLLTATHCWQLGTSGSRFEVVRISRVAKPKGLSVAYPCPLHRLPST
jgi:hypothetical protein